MQDGGKRFSWFYGVSFEVHVYYNRLKREVLYRKEGWVADSLVARPFGEILRLKQTDRNSECY